MSKHEGSGWLASLVPAVYAIAALMAVAGVYLIDPAMVDLGFGLEAERTTVVGVFVLLGGATLAFAAAMAFDALPTVSSGYVIVDVAARLFLVLIAGYINTIALGAIEIAVGFNALFASPPNLWAAALLLPGALSVVLAFATFGALENKKADADAEAGDNEEAEDGPEPEATTETTTAASGKLYGSANLRFSLFYAAYYTVAMLAFMVWMWVGYWLYYRVDGAIFAGETLDAASAAASLSEVARRMWPIALGFSALIAVLMFSLTAGGTLFKWISHRGVPDADRDLSEAETRFIDASAERVRAYARAQGYDRNVWIVQAFGFAGLMASLLAVFGAAIGVDALLTGPPPGASFPIIREPGSAWIVLWVFVAILLSPLGHSILTCASRSYSERAGWVAIGESNEYFSLTGKLTSFVRLHRLSTQSEINPGAFLNAANISFERFFYVPAAALAVVALFFTHRAFATIDTITADHIEVVDYWTLEQRRYSYSDVSEVVVRCFLTDKNEAAEGYELRFKDGGALDIYDESKVEAQRDAYDAVDAKLRALGVPFVPGERRGWSKGGERAYESDCVEKVAKNSPAGDADRVRRLFHLDELKAAETIWPWDRELAAAKFAADKYKVAMAVTLYTKAIASGRLSGHMLAVAYGARADARDEYEAAHGIRDSEMLLALGDYQKARDIEPTSRRYRDEAYVLVALGAYDDALAAHQKALALDRPKPYWPLIGLARVERARGRYDEAMRYLDQVLRVWGDDDASMAIYYHRARVLYLKGDNAAVVDAITKGLAYDAEDADAFRFRACAHARLGNFAKAKADNAQAIKIAHAPPIDDAWAKAPLAKAYYAEFESDRAVIAAMAGGTATDADAATLCGDQWQYHETPRTRSALLPPRETQR